MLFIIGVIGGASGTGSSSGTTSNTATAGNEGSSANQATSEVDNQPKEWVKVIELSGNSNKRSDTFDLTGGKTKLTYTFEGGDFVIGSIYVMKDGTSLQESGGFPEVTVSEAGTDFTFLTKKAGKYYLDITSANSDWTVVVEEER